MDSSTGQFDPSKWEPVKEESTRSKAFRKFREEPLVPLGCLATTAALVFASNSMRKGDRGKFNIFLRWRVAAQGFTVIAALGGSLYYAEERMKAKQAQQLEQVRNPPPPTAFKGTTSPKAQLER